MVINEFTIPDPDTISWETPKVIGYTIEGEPVISTGWSCELSFSLPAELDLFGIFYRLLGGRVTVTLPGPDGCETAMQGYISRVQKRVRLGVADGVDITIEYLNPLISV
jgi:hypothetical protein